MRSGGIILFFFIALALPLAASKLEKGFEAMAGHDYFKAKKLFSEINRSGPDAYASYGLALIFSRNDNPFFNVDSAARYVRLSHSLFAAAPKILRLGGLVVDAPSILGLADTVAVWKLQQLKKNGSIGQYDRFLTLYLASGKIKEEAVYLRDELEFNAALLRNSSDSTDAFLLSHPESEFFLEGTLLKDRQLFDETTAGHTAAGYKKFLKKYPKNVMVNTAYEKLSGLHKKE